MGKTNIEYCDEVSNPLQAKDMETGKKGTFCEKPDPDGTCKNCWAEVLNMRGKPDNNRFGNGLAYDRVFRDRIKWVPHYKEMERLKRLNDRKPMSGKFPGEKLVVFTNDTYDLFQPSIDDKLRDWVFGCYDHFTNINILVQTTYVSRMRTYLCGRYAGVMPKQFVVGMSAGDQKFYDDNVRHLLGIPARRRYVISEPMLGPIKALEMDLEQLHWWICGGESGPNARPMHPDWVRSIRDQCNAADVPFFFKQFGEWLPFNQITPEMARFEKREWPNLTNANHYFDDGSTAYRVGKKKAGRLLDGKIWNEFPGVNQ